MLGHFCAEVVTLTLKPFSLHKMLVSSYEGVMRQILSRKTTKIIFFEVIFAVIALKLENVGTTFSSFNPCTFLPSKATDSVRKRPTFGDTTTGFPAK